MTTEHYYDEDSNPSNEDSGPGSGDTSSTDESSVSLPSGEHVYRGLDQNAERQIRELALSLTQSSIRGSCASLGGHGQRNNQETDVAGDVYSQGTSNQYSSSIFTQETLPGVNPVFTDENAEGYTPKLDPNSPYFSSSAWVKNMTRLSRSDPDYYKPYSMGCTWRNLSASGDSPDVTYQSTFLNAPVKMVSKMVRSVTHGKAGDRFQILKTMDGCVNPGELLVVLGRPGSGCTTLLKSISSNTHGFKLGSETQISYSGISPKELRKHFRGEVVYEAESDIHLPHLTVYQTLLTVARLKTPQNRVRGVDRETYAKHLTEVAMATYGLTHTRDTKVGNELIKGVSGGERKRVSIAEVWICGSKFQCWDNATRGLDSATALEFVRALKVQTQVAENAAVVAIYQCSQKAYDMFDKVCLLYDGYQIYFGPTSEAKQYFLDMGYVCPARQTTADFLTSITSPSERVVNPEFIAKGIAVPQTAEEMSNYWRASQSYKKLTDTIDEQMKDENKEREAAIVREAHIAKQTKRISSRSPYVVNYGMQVKYLLIRNAWRIRNSAGITIFQICGNTSMALILGSMFYRSLDKSESNTFYFRGSAIFGALLFNCFQSLIEIFSLYEARPITEKHRFYSLYHPSAEGFSSILSEIPSKVITCMCFNLIFYFLCHFKCTAGAFFFYLLINITGTFAMSHLFRCIGALSKSLEESMTPASIILLALSMYSGFIIPHTTMLGWSEWIWYINPIGYLFESLMINEFHDVKYPCSTYIPFGPAYANATGDQRVCSAVGATPGTEYILGDRFLKESYGYEHKHKWRGFGVGMAYAVFFFFVYLVISEIRDAAKQKGELLIFPHDVVKRMRKQGMFRNSGAVPDSEQYPGQDELALDLEKTATVDTRNINNKKLLEDTDTIGSSNTNASSPGETAKSSSGTIMEKGSGQESSELKISDSTATFHWRNVCYDVPVKGGTRRILENVDGWVKPGTLTALMGASGAGKTTLLDCLAERTTVGVITGEIFVDGRLRDEAFPRSIGYCQQQDLHLRTATVRESLRFSAYLRQPASVSIEEKNAYVEDVIRVLEMEKYADAVVGVPGEGLNVEQRKRLTIGVELAAKPKLLVFLDEPTSGLDSQTAWSTCQLMRKLANCGQAILCTIHQPSAILMQVFDRLLFLQEGGQTVYFGGLGEDCRTMIDYFEGHGAHPCPPDANPAEWMLEVVGAAPGSHANQDYFQVWRNSDEYKAVQEELDWMESELPKITKEIDPEAHKKFSTSLFYQFKCVSIRLFQQNWRSPEYLWSKLLLSILSEMFIGFTFFKANRTLQGLQNQMLSVFMYTVIFMPLLQQYLPVFVQQRQLYEARERPSRTFSWIAFMASQMVVECPWNIFTGTCSFFIYYYSVGFYNNASSAGQLHERGALFWLLTAAFYTYIGSMALMCISFFELPQGAAHMASLMYTMCLLFCGVMVSSDELPRFWIFMYRVSPLTYLIDALLSTGVANTDVRCAPYELVEVVPPQGMTCGQYMSPFLTSMGTGYVTNPDARDSCFYCSYSRTNDFLKSFGCNYSRRWRNYGIFLVFIIFNYAASLVFYYLVRVPKTDGKISERPLKIDGGIRHVLRKLKRPLSLKRRNRPSIEQETEP